MEMPERLQTMIRRFGGADRQTRLEALLDLSRKLPPLPEHLAGAADREAHRVPECQTPVFLWVDTTGDAVTLHAEVPPESPTVRGFVALLVRSLAGARRDQVAAIPNDLLHQLGLEETLGMMRTQGLTAILQRVKRSVAAALLVLGLGLAGCTPAINYLDPEGPWWSGVSAAPAPARADRLRVVTFNVQWGREVSGAARLLADHPDLRQAGLVLLQEMDETGTAEVARALGMHWVYYPASVHPSAGGNFGNAVLSRWPIVSSGKLVLPHQGLGHGSSRIAVWATVLVQEAPIRVYSLHLATVVAVGAAGHEDQARVVVEDALAHPGPVILAGDFNSDWIGRMLVAEGFDWVTREVGVTTRRFSVDHIFVRGWPGNGTATAGAVADAGRLSDHRPVWAVLGLGTPAGRAEPPG